MQAEDTVGSDDLRRLWRVYADGLAQAVASEEKWQPGQPFRGLHKWRGRERKMLKEIYPEIDAERDGRKGAWRTESSHIFEPQATGMKGMSRTARDGVNYYDNQPAFQESDHIHRAMNSSLGAAERDDYVAKQTAILRTPSRAAGGLEDKSRRLAAAITQYHEEVARLRGEGRQAYDSERHFAACNASFFHMMMGNAPVEVAGRPRPPELNASQHWDAEGYIAALLPADRRSVILQRGAKLIGPPTAAEEKRINDLMAAVDRLATRNALARAEEQARSTAGRQRADASVSPTIVPPDRLKRQKTSHSTDLLASLQALAAQAVAPERSGAQSGRVSTADAGPATRQGNRWVGDGLLNALRTQLTALPSSAPTGWASPAAMSPRNEPGQGEGHFVTAPSSPQRSRASSLGAAAGQGEAASARERTGDQHPYDLSSAIEQEMINLVQGLERGQSFLSNGQTRAPSPGAAAGRGASPSASRDADDEQRYYLAPALERKMISLSQRLERVAPFLPNGLLTEQHIVRAEREHEERERIRRTRTTSRV